MSWRWTPFQGGRISNGWGGAEPIIIGKVILTETLLMIISAERGRVCQDAARDPLFLPSPLKRDIH
jgi:hypothetical protein